MNFYNVVKYVAMTVVALVLVLGYLSSDDSTNTTSQQHQQGPKFNF